MCPLGAACRESTEKIQHRTDITLVTYPRVVTAIIMAKIAISEIRTSEIKFSARTHFLVSTRKIYIENNVQRRPLQQDIALVVDLSQGIGNAIFLVGKQRKTWSLSG